MRAFRAVVDRDLLDVTGGGRSSHWREELPPTAKPESLSRDELNGWNKRTREAR